jgi:hypothetical protein
MPVIVRREPSHPGAQLSLFEEHNGWRHQDEDMSMDFASRSFGIYSPWVAGGIWRH